jgi:hypothetical protein
MGYKTELDEITSEAAQAARIEQLARIAYEAYAESSSNKNFRGDPMPQWERLPPQIRKHWRASADRIVSTIAQEILAS